MPGPVERWLETFMCKQYAFIFEEYGFKTLQQVCQLQPNTLQSMGIAPDHCDKILENVSVLRQSLVGSLNSGCSYPDYDHHLGNNPSSTSKFSYPATGPFPSVAHSTSQYSGHTLPYSNSQAYSGSQGTQYVSQDVIYSQPVYNNRMQQPQGSWDGGPYNQSPRHVMSSPPVLRSPPPGPTLGMTHYRQMMLSTMADPPPSHAWPPAQSQVPSPSMMHSPRTTPSPGMGHGPGSLASPSLPNRSPAHKPFSPPPFSPHGQPPPAHQQQNVTSYDFSNNQPAVSPSNHNPARPLASPSTSTASGPVPPPPGSLSSVSGSSSATNSMPSDPLQSLQKMVMQEGHTVSSDSFSPSCEASKSNFGSIDQLVGRETQSRSSECSSPSSAVSQPVKTLRSPTQDSESLHVQLSDTGSETNAPKDQKPMSDTDCVQSETQGDSRSSSVGMIPSSSPSAVAAAKSDGYSAASTPCVPLESPADVNDSVGNAEQQNGCSNGNEISGLPVDARTDDMPADLSQDSMANKSPHGRWKGAAENTLQETFQDVGLLPNAHFPFPNGTKSPPHLLAESQTLNGPTSNDASHENTEQYQLTPRPPPVSGRGTKRNRRGSARSPRQRNNPPRLSSYAEFLGNESQCHSNQPPVANAAEPDLLNTPTKLRTRRSSTAGQTVMSTPNHVMGDKTEDTRTEFNSQPCQSPYIRPSTKSPSGDSTNVTSPRAKSLRLESSPSSNRRGGRRSPEWRARTVNCVPPAASTINRAVLPQPDSSSPSVTDTNKFNALSTECTVNIKEEDTAVCLSRLNESFSSPGSSDSPSKRKRGRPLGSKNRAKSDGPEPPLKQKKSHKKKLPAETYIGDEVEEQKKGRTDKGKKTNPAETKPRGPFIHIENSPSGDLSVSVQNTPFREEEVDSRGFRKKKGAVRESRAPGLAGCTKRRMAKIGYTSTLSTKYDALTKDKTWVCELCHRGSHYNGLGDLFGPYFEDRRSATSDDDKDREVSGIGDESFRKVRAKRKRSELVEEFFKSTLAKKGKRSKEASKDGLSETDGADKFASTSEAETGPTTTKEIWIHEDCIVWSHGVYLVGNKVYGLEEATRVAADMVCSKCKETGATLGCLNKGCTEQYHYACALEKGCQLAENYSLLCSKHKKKPRQGT